MPFAIWRYFDSGSWAFANTYQEQLQSTEELKNLQPLVLTSQKALSWTWMLIIIMAMFSVCGLKALGKETEIMDKTEDVWCAWEGERAKMRVGLSRLTTLEEMTFSYHFLSERQKQQEQIHILERDGPITAADFTGLLFSFGFSSERNLNREIWVL